ncbi:hypothetical protein NIA69_22585 [Gemmiger formicilis]|nr:hypothetical protein [Gemmiger formicilis]
MIAYALATALQVGAGYALGDGLLVLAKLLAALLAAALVEMYNRTPLAVKMCRPGTASMATRTLWMMKKRRKCTLRFPMAARKRRGCWWEPPAVPGYSTSATSPS